MTEEIIIPYKGIKKKTVYHISDSHLTEYDEYSDEAEKQKALDNTQAWENVRRGFASAYGETFGEYESRSAKELFIDQLDAVRSDGDAVIFTGDTIDYISGANLRFAERELAKIAIPFSIVCGNHEQAEKIPEGILFSQAKKPVCVTGLGDMRIIALDNSKRLVTAEQNEKLRRLLSNGTPAMIAMHVPIRTEGNYDRLTKSGEYFMLNYDGCPQSNVDFIGLLKEYRDNIICVLAGHLHYKDVSDIAPGLTQYVVAQAIGGRMNKFVIGE
ncbi:MAG: metallophosphoesterase [Clostridia bacterium]|nr:metallophosphoesterase [Clostridia bacterium]MBO4453164.1 metallophosphoesterase [Clostridia bacterium]